MAYPIPQSRYTEDEYLAFERKAEERSEYVDSWRYFFADGLESAIRIPSIDCELKLAEVYYLINFPPTEEELEEMLHQA